MTKVSSITDAVVLSLRMQLDLGTICALSWNAELLDCTHSFRSLKNMFPETAWI